MIQENSAPLDRDTSIALERGAQIASSLAERRRIAGLLASVDRDGLVSQRNLASELGIAVGLVNSYVKRCVKKGLIKIHEVPSRRYAYYLTPRGFAEKSRLTAEYLSTSLDFFRGARADCAAACVQAHRRGWQSVGLIGGSDLAEIAILAATEQRLRVNALVDAGASRTNIMGVPFVASADAAAPQPDGWFVTTIDGAQAAYDETVSRFGAGSVIAPKLLAIRLAQDTRQADLATRATGRSSPRRKA